jgi:hypothetical protein
MRRGFDQRTSAVQKILLYSNFDTMLISIANFSILRIHLTFTSKV